MAIQLDQASVTGSRLHWRAARAPRTELVRWAIELLGLGVLLALIFVVATAVAQPHFRTQAAASDVLRYLVWVWPPEHNETDTFRWSSPHSRLRLFGLDQQGPIIVRARLSASRKPGMPLAQLAIDGAQPVPPFPIKREWRRYALVLPPPPRDAEARTVDLHSIVVPPHDDSRDIGVAIDWVEASQHALAPSEHLPEPGRLAFMVLLGLLGYTALRRVRLGRLAALAMVLTAGLLLGFALARAPGQVAYWLPNLWLALLIGWLAVVLPPFVRALRRRWLARQRPRWLAGAALAIAGAQLVLPLQQSWSSVVGWALLVGGGIVLAGAVPGELGLEDKAVSRRAVAFVLLGCTLLALSLRLIGLDQIPVGMWRDEARHGLLALRILHEPDFRPVYVPNVADLPALLFYLATLPIGLFGPHPWTIRLVPALAGALTPLALYFAARPLFGSRAALLSAGLVAVSAWHISLSRLAFPTTLGLLLTLLALGLLYRALRPGAVGVRVVQAALAGSLTGLALYAYHSSRMSPLACAVVGAIMLGPEVRAWRAALPRLVVAVLMMLLVAAPLIHYAITKPGRYNQRIFDTSIFNDDSLAGRAPLARIEENVRVHLGMWSERGDRIGRHNLPNAPLLDPLTGAVFAAGVALTLAQMRDRRRLALLGWLGVMMIPGLFSIEAPHAMRTVESIGPTMVLASIGGCTLAAWLVAGAGNSSGLRWRRLLGVGLLVGIVGLNLTRYFVVWPTGPKVYSEFYVAETRIGEAVQRLSRLPVIESHGYQVFVPEAALEKDVLRYLTWGFDVGVFKGSRFSVPPGERALLVTYGDKRAIELERTLQALDGAMLLSSGPRSPIDGQPEFRIYGRGPEARAAVAQLLATWPALR